MVSTSSAVWRMDNHVVHVRHLEKLFWPEVGFAKGDMLRYYRQIAPIALPHFRARPPHETTHRGDLVTIDDAQISVGRNTAAPYTLRAGAARPCVSTPLSWEEIAAGGIHPADFTPEVVPERVRCHGDLFASVLHEGQHLPERIGNG